MGHYFKDFSGGDFDAFAGAEPFPNGDPPQICFMANDAAVVVEKTGFTVVYEDECWYIPAAFYSARAARRFGGQLLSELECSPADIASRLEPYLPA